MTSGGKILIVDDRPDDVTLTQRALRRNNITNAVDITTDAFLDAVRGLGMYWLLVNRPAGKPHD
ncbi:hypothetical protein [Actinoplanes sp. NPDC026670]|uniref:hypothetical protein n=1 Tax=Actinoplanes sp. NPDC026670 TaxID=3154700 RepID=UPI0033EF37B0